MKVSLPAAIQVYKEKVRNAAGNNKHVKNKMHVFYVLHAVERNPDGIKDAAQSKKDEAA